MATHARNSAYAGTVPPICAARITNDTESDSTNPSARRSAPADSAFAYWRASDGWRRSRVAAMALWSMTTLGCENAANEGQRYRDASAGATGAAMDARERAMNATTVR